MSEILFPRVAIIGVGLIGGSFALGLRAADAVSSVLCGDADKMNVAKAIELEIVDIGSRSNAEAVRDADLVVLSTPVGAFSSVAPEIAPYLKSGAIVMDVGSVKGAAMKALALLPKTVSYVPAHPIAGTEDSGPEAAFPELFQGKWCLLTPDPSTPQSAIDKVRAAWEACGARVATMSADHHDRVLAIVSHLPHMFAFTMMGTADDFAKEIGEDVIGFAGSSFRDFTRVAASDPVMWRDIFLSNRDAVLDVLGRFRAHFEKLEGAVRDGDGAAMEALLNRGRSLRRGLGGPRVIEAPHVSLGEKNS